VIPVSDAGVADIIGAASLLISEAALGELVARAAGTAAAEPASDSPTTTSTPTTGAA
jgi:large subunit ribosomal protein L4